MGDYMRLVWCVVLVLLLVVPASTAQAPIATSGGSIQATVGNGSQNVTPDSSPTTNTDGGSSGGGSCHSVWDDCAYSVCVGGLRNVTCSDTKCGRIDLVSVETCVTPRDEIVLLDPLPPWYLRNDSVQEEVLEELVPEPISPEPEVIEEPVMVVEFVEVDDAVGRWERFKDWVGDWCPLSKKNRENKTEELDETKEIVDGNNESFWFSRIKNSEGTTNWVLPITLLLMVLLALLILFLKNKNKKALGETLIKPDEPITTKPTSDEQAFTLPEEYRPAYDRIMQALEAGHSPEAIVETFKKSGWDESQLNILFKEITKKR